MNLLERFNGFAVSIKGGFDPRWSRTVTPLLLIQFGPAE